MGGGIELIPPLPPSAASDSVSDGDGVGMEYAFAFFYSFRSSFWLLAKRTRNTKEVRCSAKITHLSLGARDPPPHRAKTVRVGDPDWTSRAPGTRLLPRQSGLIGGHRRSQQQILRSAQDFACGLPLGFTSLTPAKRLKLSKITAGIQQIPVARGRSAYFCTPDTSITVEWIGVNKVLSL